MRQATLNEFLKQENVVCFTCQHFSPVKNNFAYVGKELPKQQRNGFDDIDYPSNMSKYELSIRIEMVLDEAIFTVAVLSIFCNNELLQISDIALVIKHLC